MTCDLMAGLVLFLALMFSVNILMEAQGIAQRIWGLTVTWIIAIAVLILMCGCSAQAQTPPMPQADTNLVEVGQVQVAWDSMTNVDQSIAWYGIYSSTNGATNSLVSSVIIGVGETNASCPLWCYGTNWISATCIDALFSESLQCAPISFVLTCKPITNVVTVTGAQATSPDLLHWFALSNLSTIVLTNPLGQTFFRGSNTTITRINL